MGQVSASDFCRARPSLCRGSSFPISRFKVWLPFNDPPAKDLQLRNHSLSVLGRGQHKLIDTEGITGYLSEPLASI